MGGIRLAKWFLEGGNASASGGVRPVPEPGGDRWSPRKKAFKTFPSSNLSANNLEASPESVPFLALAGKGLVLAPGRNHATRSGMSVAFSPGAEISREVFFGSSRGQAMAGGDWRQSRWYLRLSDA